MGTMGSYEHKVNCTYELTVVVTACTRFVQAQATSNIRFERKIKNTLPLFNLGATGSYYILGEVE